MICKTNMHSQKFVVCMVSNFSIIRLSSDFHSYIVLQSGNNNYLNHFGINIHLGRTIMTDE